MTYAIHFHFNAQMYKNAQMYHGSYNAQIIIKGSFFIHVSPWDLKGKTNDENFFMRFFVIYNPINNNSPVQESPDRVTCLIKKCN